MSLHTRPELIIIINNTHDHLYQLSKLSRSQLRCYFEKWYFITKFPPLNSEPNPRERDFLLFKNCAKTTGDFSHWTHIKLTGFQHCPYQTMPPFQQWKRTRPFSNHTKTKGDLSPWTRIHPVGLQHCLCQTLPSSEQRGEQTGPQSYKFHHARGSLMTEKLEESRSSIQYIFRVS